MSGLPRKLKKPMLPTGSMRPEDVAMRPRPSINAIGPGKRPISMVSAHNAIPLTKKPRNDEPSSSAVQPVQRPLIEVEDLQAFAAKGKCNEIDEANFSEAVNKAIDETKFNKACRLIVAYLLKVIKKSQTTSKGAFDAEQMAQIGKVITENGEKLTNVFMYKVLFWGLSVMKNSPNVKQGLFVAMITRLAMDQPQLHPFLLQAFLGDCLGERIWIDKPHSEQLVSLILKRFNTRFPSLDSVLYKMTTGEISPPTWIPNSDVVDKFPPNTEGMTEEEREKEQKKRRKEKDTGKQPNEEKEDETLPPLRINIVEDALTILRRSLEQQIDSPKLLRTLTVFCGLGEIRCAAASRMDNWLQNPKVQKQALELLFFLGVNIEDLTNKHDAEAIGHLLRMKSLKSKQVQSVFNALTNHITTNAENCRIFTKELALNEFGPQATRSPHNMILLQSMFLHNNSLQTKVFAEEMCDILFERQDMIRAACIMIRELIRSHLRADFSFSRFLAAYLNSCSTRMFSGKHFNDETVMKTTLSICSLIVWIGISQQVRDEFSKRRQGEAFNTATYNRFSNELNEYYENGIKWLRSACSMFDDKKDYVLRLYSILFLDKGSFLINTDGGPSEPEWAICQRIIAETHPTTRLISLIVSDQSLQQTDCIQILHLITERLAKNLTYADETLPFIEGLGIETIDAVYELARYKSRSATNNQPSPLFIVDLFWRITFVTFVWTCLGRSTLLKDVHDKYANLRLLMLVGITENVVLPATLAKKIKENENSLMKEQQGVILEIEKADSHNANLSLEESELNKLCFVNPMSDIYRAPPAELIASIGSFCKAHKVGAHLCETRSPDLLHEFIELVGTGEALYAITSFINRDPGAISTLSLEALCEVVLLRSIDETSSSDENWTAQKEKIFERLMESSKSDTKVLFFIMDKLTNARDPNQRTAMLQILNRIYSQKPESIDDDDDPVEFLQIVPSLRNFGTERYSFIISLAGQVKEAIHVLKIYFRACKFETNAGHLKKYLKFINDHVSPQDDFGKVVRILSPIGLMKDQTIKTEMLSLYLRYNQAMKERAEVGLSNDNLCVVQFKEKKIYLDYDVIISQIQLLCSSLHSENGSARKELLDLWFPEDGAKVQVTQKNETLNIFNETLLANMLCTEDERIVNVALSGITPESAVALLRRFGLALNCASRLLLMLDKLKIDSVGLPEALKTLPFAIGYRTRGAKGGDQFVKMLNKRQPEVNKEEAHEFLICEPLPRLSPTPTYMMPQLLDAKDIVNKIKTAIAASSELNFESSEVCSIYSNEKVALACLELVEGSLKYLLDHPDTFLQIMLLLSSAAERFPAVQTQLATWSTKVLKGAQPPPVVAGILQNFVSAMVTAKKTQKAQLNNADDVLKQLQEKDDLNNAERSRLVAYFLQFRPEIVDGGKHMMEQAEALFLSKNQTFVWLCSQLPQHCLPETMVSILAFLLSNFNSKLNPSSVLSFLSFCANSGNSLAFKEANDAQLNVLAQYLCAAVFFDTKFDELAVSIVVAVETSAGSRVLRPIIETCIREARQGVGLVKQESIERLISNVNERYPCLQVDMVSGLALLSFVNWRADESNIKATQLLTGAFSATNPEKIVDQLETLLRVYPKIIERQIGMLSRLLAQLVSMNSRNVKDRMSLVAFSIRVLYQLIPVAEQGTLEHVDALISVLISFAERHLLEKRQTINETILRTCLRYLDSHQTRAQALLSEHPETILKLCDGISDRYFVEQIQAAVRVARTN